MKRSVVLLLAAVSLIPFEFVSQGISLPFSTSLLAQKAAVHDIGEVKVSDPKPMKNPSSGIGEVEATSILATPEMMRRWIPPRLSPAETARLVAASKRPRFWSRRIETFKQQATQRAIRGERLEKKLNPDVKLNPDPSPKAGNPRFSYTTQTCQGPSQVNASPADPSLALGGGSYALVTNSEYRVGFKSIPCGTRRRQNISNFFLEPDLAVTDSRIIYDRFRNRWVAVSIRRAVTPSATNILKIAVSTTEDPAGGFRIYTINFNLDGERTTPEYPMIGLSRDYIFITVDRINEPTGKRFGNIIHVPKSSLYSGIATFKIISRNASGRRLPAVVAPPIVKDNIEPSYSNFIATNWEALQNVGYTNNLIQYRLTPAQNRIQEYIISVPRCQVPPTALQPIFESYRLDTLGPFFQGSSIQINNDLWNIHTSGKSFLGINSGEFSELRYYRIDTNSRAARDTKVIRVGTTNADFDYHSAIDVDVSSTVVRRNRRPWIAWISSGRTRRPTLYFSTCSSGVDSCTFSAKNVAFASTSPLTAPIDEATRTVRFADYSSISVDPFSIDPSLTGRIWVFGQWINSTTKWSTKYSSIGYR